MKKHECSGPTSMQYETIERVYLRSFVPKTISYSVNCNLSLVRELTMASITIFILRRTAQDIKRAAFRLHRRRYRNAILGFGALTTADLD